MSCFHSFWMIIASKALTSWLKMVLVYRFWKPLYKYIFRNEEHKLLIRFHVSIPWNSVTEHGKLNMNNDFPKLRINHKQVISFENVTFHVQLPKQLFRTAHHHPVGRPIGHGFLWHVPTQPSTGRKLLYAPTQQTTIATVRPSTAGIRFVWPPHSWIGVTSAFRFRVWLLQSDHTTKGLDTVPMENRTSKRTNWYTFRERSN